MISTFGWIIICLLVLIIKQVFLQPAEDKNLFILYAARDEVAIKAVEGKISQDAKEYKFVINAINDAIFYIKNNYDFSIMITNLFFKPASAKKSFDNIMELVKKYDFLVKNYDVTIIYLIRSLNIRIFFFIYLIVYPLYFLLMAVLFLLEIWDKITDFSIGATKATKERMKAILEINETYHNYKKSYAK